jgi:hypothetical protein
MERLRRSAKRFLLMAAQVFLFFAGGCGPTQRDLGNTVVSKVEEYKRSKDTLPASLSETGIKEEESGPHYCKTGENSYIVWYQTMLGKSDTYDSQTKKWSEAQRPFCRVP